MKEKIYNKLVRDKIPEIIAQQGKQVTFSTLKFDEFKQALKDKFIEEATELVNAETLEQIIEEMADIYEVLNAMQLYLTETVIATPVILNAMHEKRKNKGGFEKMVFLLSVTDRNRDD